MKEPGSTSDRVEALDGIRGVAILLVLMDHFQAYTMGGLPAGLQRIGRAISENGWMGVDVFFVLSGFLITRILLSIKTKPDFWRYFYLRRFFRIVPVVAWACIPMGVLLVVRHHITTLQALLFLSPVANWELIRLNTPQFTHMWSLGVEEQFYFVWPFVIRAVERRRVLESALLIAGGSVIAHLAAFALGFSPMAIYKSTPTHLFGIALGSAIAAALHAHYPNFCAVRWSSLLLKFGGAFLLAGLVVAYAVYGEWWYHWDNPATTVFGIVGSSMITGWCIINAVTKCLPKALYWLFMHPVVRWFGRRSYAIYLVHVILSSIVIAIFSSLVLRGIVLIGGSLLLAELSWRFIETPSLALGARLTRHRETLLQV